MLGKFPLKPTVFWPALAVALAWVSLGFAQSAPSWNGPDQLLLYRNGNLLRGRIERELGRYVVLTSSGSRMVIPVEQVDFVCGSLQEAYQRKRDRLPPVTADAKLRPTARIEFFQWCIKQGLFAEAEAELTELQMSRLSASELYAYLRQLHSAMERAELAQTAPTPKSPAASPTPPPPAVVLSDLPAVGPPLATVLNHPQANPLGQPTAAPPLRAEVIKPVSFEEPAELPPASSALPVPELEMLLKRLPTEGVSLYKRRVEPLLFRNCSNAGCHDPEKTRLPLQRLARGEGIPKRMSQQNLIQVLRFTSSGVSGDSPLLTAATTAHGGAVKAPLKLDSEHYRLLAAWVERMAAPANAAGIPQVHSPLFSAATLPMEDRPPADARPIGGNLSPGSLPTGLVGPGTPVSQTAPASAKPPEIPQLERAADAFVPADPFDPAIFNRRKNPAGQTGSNSLPSGR